MNRSSSQTLALICLLLLVRCGSSPKPKKVVINPLAERITALEMDLKDQSKEMARLHSLIHDLRQPKSITKTENSDEDLKFQHPAPPVVKLKPQDKEEIRPISPLMDELETVADSSQDSMQSYYRGLQLYQQKKYEDAVETLRAFISENPNHVYADRAQFLIADSYFLMKEYGMVIVATNLLETKYPFSQKMAEATYKRGIAFIEMNDLAQAKTALNQLMKNFPKEPSAELARKKWAEISKDSPTRVQ